MDQFCLTISHLPSIENVRVIISDIAKIFDVMGWLSPMIAQRKVLQCLCKLTLFPERSMKYGCSGDLNSPLSQASLFLAVTLQKKQALSQFNYMASVMLQKMPMQVLSTYAWWTPTESAYFTCHV